MAEIIRIPKLGLSDYGTLVSWEVDVGEPIAEGEVVAILESEKASADIESPIDGVLLDTYVEESEEISIDVGRPLGVVGEEGESVPALEDLDAGGKAEAEEAESGEAEAGEAATGTAGADASAGGDGATSAADVKATPRAKKRAEELGVDLTAVEGTGPQGAVTEDDVEAHAEGDDEGLTVVESRELSGTRKAIAERLSQSAREKPHVMGTREIGIEPLVSARERLASEHGLEVSLNDLLLYLVGQVLEDHPEFNAHFEDGEHRLIEEVNVGYAVDAERGLVVPVIDDVTDRSLEELADRRRTLVERVLEDEHDSEDLQGGTFTVTNVGVFDMDVSYSIINPPEVAILAIGRRKHAPVERDGEVDFEEVITFSLTIDHRVLDGADSGAFLETLAEYVASPESVLEPLQ